MRKGSDDGFVSASELARMGYCERKVAFDAAFGEEVAPARRKAQLRGLQAHDAFYQESLRLARGSATKGRCFVATMVLGDCEDTRALRAFRDLYMRRSVAGRWLIGAYYRGSPGICAWMNGKPNVLAAVRVVVRWIASAAGAAVEMKVRRP